MIVNSKPEHTPVIPIRNRDVLEDTPHKNASCQIYIIEKHYDSLFICDLHVMK